MMMISNKWGDWGQFMVNNGEREYGNDKTFKNGDRYPSGEFMYIEEKNMLTRLKY
jgi:hypothetical protein